MSIGPQKNKRGQIFMKFIDYIQYTFKCEPFSDACTVTCTKLTKGFNWLIAVSFAEYSYCGYAGMNTRF